MATLVPLIKSKIKKLCKEILVRSVWIRSLQKAAAPLRVLQVEVGASAGAQHAQPCAANATAWIHTFPSEQPMF